MPFVTFIAIIFVYNKLISDNEITVMASTGLSPAQIAKPAIVLSIVLTLLHLGLNLFIIPKTQSLFYSTQWNLRYGLAHMKLQESAFTKIADGLVVYVDEVSGYDLSEVMLSDERDSKSQISIFSEKGKLIATDRGLSIVMKNGSMQVKGDGITTGTFDTFDMDLNLGESGEDDGFRVRRVSTVDLVRNVLNVPTERQYKKVLSELASRFLGPLMNLILALLCTVILLKSSLLRRRASFAPALAVLAMAAVMSLFMAASNMLESLIDFLLLACAQFFMLIMLLRNLYKK